MEKQLLNKKWKLGLGLRVEGSDPGSLSVPSAAREADGIFISQSEISLKRVARTKSWVDRVTPIFSLVQTFSKNIPPICWSHTHKKTVELTKIWLRYFFFCYVKELRFGPKEFNIIFFSGLIWHWSNRKVPRRTDASKKKKKIIQPPPNPLGGGSALASEPKKFQKKKKRVSTKL